MRKAMSVLAVVALCGAATRAQAEARTWNVCGGSRFASCASVGVLIVGQNVTLRLWNMSGFFATDPNTVFTAVGFTNVGTAMAVTNSLTMSGPARSGDSPGSWRIRNDRTTPSMFLDLLTQTEDGRVDDGIASGCANNLPTGQFWENPCSLPSGISDPGYVQLNFQITGTWDLANTIVDVHGNNRGESTDCITGGDGQNCFGVAVPEPITMTLMITGLAGMGGMGLIRRRRGRDIKNG